MSVPHVAAFTDTYLPTVNGVTYTVKTWREQWQARGGRMDVVYPGGDHEPKRGEHPVRSLPFPFYEGFKVGAPQIPNGVTEADIVHVHTPFSLGIAGRRLARARDRPIVASYHTPTTEYAAYLSERAAVERSVSAVARRYERWFLGQVDRIIVPSERTATHVREEVSVSTPVDVVTNGVDTDFFEPVEAGAFRNRYELPAGPLVGYTGRHGYEKCLDDIVDAADGLDATLVFGGDGPAREELEAAAAAADVEARFLGFLPREELPAFYAALDVFAFPSPVETEGLVAMEANACGTPVVGVDRGALSDTVIEGETGYRYPEGDIEAFRAGIERVLADDGGLRARCLDRREEMSVEHAVDRLADVYANL
jgi:glycosyltransferase involved in cell wall biosynthesis